MGSTQMNLRIDGEVKRGGDAALASIGCTPTEAVRTLWNFAAAHRGNPEALRRQLDAMRSMDLEAEVRRERRRQAQRDSLAPSKRFLAEAGLSSFPMAAEGYGELREAALLDRMREKGLW